MWGTLVRLLTSLSRGLLRNVLTGAGVMLGSYAVIMVAYNSAVNAVHNSMGGIPSDVLALISLAGFDTSMSIILSAIATRVALNQDKLFLKRGS